MYHSLGRGVATARLLSSAEALDGTALRHPALPVRCHGAQEVSSTEGVVKGRLGRLSANPLLQVETSQKRQWERVNLQKKSVNKRKKRSKGTTGGSGQPRD